MTIIYHEEHGDLNQLTGKRVGIVGYGNMGRPTALNLRDSGIRILVSDPSPDKQFLAAAEGFDVVELSELAPQVEVILLLVRDEAMPKLYLDTISPHLRRGHALIFSSAYNIAFGFIEPPGFVDVGLVSARTIGAAVRERFVSGEGFASFVAVAQDASRNAWPLVLAVARAMGALRGGAIEIRFEQEAELDLFMQQAILPVFHQAIIMAAQLLIERGYSPEAVFTELYLSGETADYLRQAAQAGMTQALKLQSLTAQYGTLSRFERFNDLKLERMMEITLDEIRSGQFAREWSREYNADYPRLRALLRAREAQDLWELEQQTIEALHRNTGTSTPD
ncbi:MAG: NAD(P)-binding domain-containing protein [Anaerolinea sp.]|nr:NAD(P)-binding domain-containing protein [Anaerolinea sp.]